jgi:hypothetical protein
MNRKDCTRDGGRTNDKIDITSIINTIGRCSIKVGITIFYLQLIHEMKVDEE